MNLDSRLRKLEDIQKQSNVQVTGFKNFITYDDETYFLSCSQPKGRNPLSPRPISYRDSFTIDGKEAFNKQQLDDLAKEGWQIIIIRYTQEIAYQQNDNKLESDFR